MARKRMIAPEIWTDPKIMKISEAALVVFIGLISCADDEGIVEADPTSIHFKLARSSLSPGSVATILDELAAHELIVLYGDWLFLPRWYRYQKLRSAKPTKSPHPRPPQQALDAHPEYVAGWQYTFEEKEFPFATCYSGPPKELAPSCQPVANQLPTSCQPVAPKVRERKRRESKSTRIKTPSAAAETAEVETFTGDLLYDELKAAFLDKNGGKFKSWGRECKALKELVNEARARGPDDPRAWLERLMDTFLTLRNRDEFWAKHPVLPHVVNSSGLFPMLIEAMNKPTPDAGWVDELAENDT